MRSKSIFAFILSIISIFYNFDINAQSFEFVNSQFEASGFECMAKSPDKKYVVSGHLNGTIVVWDLEKLQAVQHINALKGTVVCLAFNKSGNKLGVCGWDNNVQIYRYLDCKLLDTVTAPMSILTFVTFNPDDQWIFFGEQNQPKTKMFGEQVVQLPFGALLRASVNISDGEVDEVVKD